MNNFIAIDVETANSDMSSICQIGIVKYVKGELVEEWESLINPEVYFDSMNINIHGITKKDVKNSPTFREVAKKIGEFLNNSISVSHGHFDRVSINQATAKYGLPEFQTTWLDSTRVVRRTWKELSQRGYGLANVCDKIGYDFQHHDALEDAKACAQVLLAALNETGLDVEAWVKRETKPIDSSRKKPSERVARDGDYEGVLYGEVIVFTGSLSIERSEAADLAASIGCSVTKNVTKTTSLLVVGDQDISQLARHEKSRKHRRAEELITQGQKIRILKESDFKELVK